MSNLLTAEINFKGDTITTMKEGSIEYVAMKHIVKNLGMSWGAQQQKLQRNKDKFGCIDIDIPSSGGIQRMLCIPLKKLNGWLFSINPAKVKASIRNKLIQYQEECFAALYDYWTKGYSSRKKLNLSEAEIEAHEIAKYDTETFALASQGSRDMNDRKKAIPVIQRKIRDWESRHLLQFDFVLVQTGIGRLTRS
ncbi:phage antirepressor N-terminal domain-containing protein [Xenorhabdus khoisanae]|uniref:phage antirepressor N-terminal domain-containing protein n=2 Tax=Xenorhabdus TaxID=626 RepID=UPI00069F89DB